MLLTNQVQRDIQTELPPGEAAQFFDSGQVVTISAGHAVHDTYSAFLPPLLPELIQRFTLSNAQAGLLSAFLQFPSIFQPLIGYLADRISLRYLVILAPGITATAMSLLGITPTYALMAILLTVAGVGSAGLHAVGPAMAGRVSGERLGRGMSFWMVGGELGRTIGPILIVSAIGWFGLAGLWWLMLGGWMASLVLYLRLRGISGKPVNSGKGLHWRAAIRQMRPFLIALALLQIGRSFASVALTTYLPVYLRQGGTSLWWAGASLSLLEAAGVVGALAGGSVSDRFGRRRVLAIALALTSVLILLFIYLPEGYRNVLLPLLGFFSLSTSPVLMAIAQECYPENRAMSNGVYMALTFVIQSIIMVVFGAISDAIGLPKTYLLSAILLLVGLPAVHWFPVLKTGAESSK